MALTDLRPSPRPVVIRTTAPAQPRRAPRRAGTTNAWASAGLVLLALASALAGLHVVLQGISWWIVGTGFAAAVLLAAAAARALVRRALWPPLIALGVGIAALTLGYAGDTAILGIIPTLSTPARLGALVDSGMTSIVEQRVPATPELGIVLLIAVLMVACAWFAELCIASEHPAYVAIPLAAVLAIPMAIRPNLTDTFWYLPTAVLYLVILRIGRRPDNRKITALIAVVAVGGSLLVPYALPAVRTDGPVAQSGLRTGINPLVTLGDDLRRGNPILALSYTTNAAEPVYLRLTTLDNFAGKIWAPSQFDPASASTDLEAFGRPPGLTPAVRRTEASVEVTVADILSRWLPTPYPTTSLTGAVGEWEWEPSGLAVRSTQAGARGQQYTANFLEVQPTQEQLAATTPGAGPVGSADLGLPDEGLPEIITQTALTVAGQAASAYDQALALQEYLRSPPFAYSEDTPVEDGFDGSGIDALAVFLQKKVGYCVHYASAMAVMARVLGIPSRIAVGFQPGEGRFDNGKMIYSVTSNDLHAWPELYFDGIGWLRFEPTPGRGEVPEYGTDPVDDPNTPQDESAPGATTAPVAPTATAGPLAGREGADGGLGADAQQSSPALGIALGVLGLLVVLALTPAGFRIGVRRRRVHRMRSGPDPASAAWDELRDTARDFGWSAPDSETPRTFAHRLGAKLPGGAEALGILRGTIERTAYGRPDAATVSVAHLTAVRREIARSSPWGLRVRVFLLPPSLRARWRVDPD